MYTRTKVLDKHVKKSLFLAFKFQNIQILKHSKFRTFKFQKIQMSEHSNFRTFKFQNIQISEHYHCSDPGVIYII